MSNGNSTAINCKYSLALEWVKATYDIECLDIYRTVNHENIRTLLHVLLLLYSIILHSLSEKT